VFPYHGRGVDWLADNFFENVSSIARQLIVLLVWQFFQKISTVLFCCSGKTSRILALHARHARVSFSPEILFTIFS